MIALRFIVPEGTSAEHPILQCRTNLAVDASGAFCSGVWSEWEKVPLVGVPWAEFVNAKTRGVK